MNFQWVMLAKCMGWEVLGPPYGAPKHRKALGKRPAGVADMDVRDQTPRQEVAWVRRGPQGRGRAGGEPDKDDGPVDRRPGERAHRDCAPRAFRAAGRAAKSRAIRGVLLFGSFFLDKQEKATCRGSATHKYTPPAGRLDRVGLG